MVTYVIGSLDVADMLLSLACCSHVSFTQQEDNGRNIKKPKSDDTIGNGSNLKLTIGQRINCL